MCVINTCVAYLLQSQMIDVHWLVVCLYFTGDKLTVRWHDGMMVLWCYGIVIIHMDESEQVIHIQYQWNCTLCMYV